MATHFIQNDPAGGSPATFDTEVRVLYDDQALYFGVFAHDDDRRAIIVSDLKKDFNIDTQRRLPRRSSTPSTTGGTAISSPPIPPAPSGTRRWPTRGARTTRTGTASGT